MTLNEFMFFIILIFGDNNTICSFSWVFMTNQVYVLPVLTHIKLYGVIVAVTRKHMDIMFSGFSRDVGVCK
jgi:hypothetical protein